MVYEFYDMKCPSCGSVMKFSTICGHQLEVNCESKRRVTIKDMLELIKGCRNPLCKWSVIQERD